MADLIETRVIAAVVDRLKERADRRRNDAIAVPCLGPIYTGMAHVTDELVVELQDVLKKHTLRTTDNPTPSAESEVNDER